MSDKSFLCDECNGTLRSSDGSVCGCSSFVTVQHHNAVVDAVRSDRDASVAEVRRVLERQLDRCHADLRALQRVIQDSDASPKWLQAAAAALYGAPDEPVGDPRCGAPDDIARLAAERDHQQAIIVQVTKERDYAFRMEGEMRSAVYEETARADAAERERDEARRHARAIRREAGLVSSWPLPWEASDDDG